MSVTVQMDSSGAMPKHQPEDNTRNSCAERLRLCGRQGSLCEHSGQKTRARPEPAWTGRGPSPSGCGAVTRAVPGARDSCSHEALDDGTNRRSRRCLTATVTATAPANDKRQRSAAPKDGRMSCSNWDRSGLKSGSSTVPPCVTSSMLKGRSPQFRNLICARICAQDAAGQAETGETRTT